MSGCQLIAVSPPFSPGVRRPVWRAQRAERRPGPPHAPSGAEILSQFQCLPILNHVSHALGAVCIGLAETDVLVEGSIGCDEPGQPRPGSWCKWPPVLAPAAPVAFWRAAESTTAHGANGLIFAARLPAQHDSSLAHLGGQASDRCRRQAASTACSTARRAAIAIFFQLNKIGEHARSAVGFGARKTHKRNARANLYWSPARRGYVSWWSGDVVQQQLVSVLLGMVQVSDTRLCFVARVAARHPLRDPAD